MQTDHSKAIVRYRFSTLIDQPVEHGIFARHGGVSQTPYHSLNLGGTTGDAVGNVVENRRRMFEFVQRPVESLFDVWQVHGNQVIEANQPRELGSKHQPADAIITNNPNITLLMRFADCVPLLIFDPIQHAIGLVHAGWQGTVKRVAEKAVLAMEQKYGSNPESLIVGIGPSIGSDHYEVRETVIQAVGKNLAAHEDQVLLRKADKTFFDLTLANQLILNDLGVSKVEQAQLCTACHVDDWFSYRIEGEKSGRFGVLIALK